MTEGIDIKTPRRVKREGDQAPAGTPVRKAVPRPRTDGSPAPRPRPLKSGVAPASAGAAPRPRPTAKRRPDEGAEAAQAVPVRRPSAARPARREKSLEGLGRLLKTKREIHGLTRRDVVVKIKIPLDQLEAIEEGRLSSLPPVFAKGFLRAYANELGLDAEAVLEDYRQLTGGFKNEPASREPLAPRYVETSVGRAGMNKKLKAVILVVAVVLLVAALLIWLVPGLKSNISSSVPDLPILNDQKEADGGYIAIPAGGGDQAPRDIADVDWSDPSMWAVPNIDEEDSIGGSIPQVTSAGGILTLISKADKAWVQVEVDGQKEYHVMKKDQQLTWQARRSITVTTGSANTMAANWNGQVINELSNSPAAKVTFPQGG